MNILIAPLAYKESLAAFEVAHAMERGVKKAIPHANSILSPIADGGDGTLEILKRLRQSVQVDVLLSNALGEKKATHYLIQEDTAIIEVASICGLAQIPFAQRNPAIATSLGVGEAILDALNKNIRQFLICLGGSATNDAGAGILQALGCRMLDKSGNELPLGGLPLRSLHSIDNSKMDLRLKQASFQVACDVSNTLLGPKGASLMYAPQKGATLEIAEQLEHALGKFAAVIKKEWHLDIGSLPYSGSAGGISAGLFALLNAKLSSGIELILELNHMEEKVQNADCIITGEGRIDEQTLYEKGIYALAKLASKYQKPLLAIPGSLGTNYTALHKAGVSTIIPLSFVPLNEIPMNTSTLLTDATEQVMRCFVSRFNG
jgi:glycerate kinase